MFSVVIGFSFLFGASVVADFYLFFVFCFLFLFCEQFKANWSLNCNGVTTFSLKKLMLIFLKDMGSEPLMYKLLFTFKPCVIFATSKIPKPD